VWVAACDSVLIEHNAAALRPTFGSWTGLAPGVIASPDPSIRIQGRAGAFPWLWVSLPAPTAAKRAGDVAGWGRWVSLSVPATLHEVHGQELSRDQGHGRTRSRSVGDMVRTYSRGSRRSSGCRTSCSAGNQGRALDVLSTISYSFVIVSYLIVRCALGCSDRRTVSGVAT
jgi:hypothetical protein